MAAPNVARRRLHSQLERRGSPPSEIARADEVLDPEALTIGFARRFTGYKRASLLFHDLERIKKIIMNDLVQFRMAHARRLSAHQKHGFNIRMV